MVVDVNLLNEDGKEYIEIVVHPSTSAINYKGEYHYRSGGTKQLLTGPALTQFLLTKLGHTWDSDVIDNVSVSDLHNDSFEIFKKQAILRKRMEPEDLELSNEELLNHLDLLSPEGKLTRAAILLFHNTPEKWIAGSHIKIGFFETDADLRYQDEIRGSLISQAEKVIDLLFTKYLKADISYDGVTRVETYPYPQSGIREAVYNAIVHKAYHTLIPIQISVYDDKLYIGNDCVFPQDWTAADLMVKHRSRPHNPHIASVFFRAGFIEAWGRGIEKICIACNAHGIPVPDYKVSPSEIMVLFRGLENIQKETIDLGVLTSGPLNGPLNGPLKSIEEMILHAINSNPKITKAELAQVTGKGRTTLTREMKKLVDAGKIKRIGSDKTGHWELIKQ